ncbi:hypothetical protein B0A48_02094 [Cryoendolithus antarcticus]|uniref:SWR1-complex protein 3 domain-containing protein n=1 Tax=Cryoendolithus antarcticus TaxID=1507870 RepID=A0A1V8TN41_9PEZI|nr:hypothetical protein B0A48_02094 [Cryoendolithus antarcticus]
MATSPEPSPAAGTKRKFGRPKNVVSLPAMKKQKTGHSALDSSQVSTPTTLQSPALPGTPRSAGLPSKVSSHAPLPLLPQPQALDLQDSEYQSLAASGVLAACLARSRHAWTNEGLFERFYTMPSKGKSTDPIYKAMKSRGKCRLRIEPHIFEVEIYVVEREQPRPPPKPVRTGPAPLWYGGWAANTQAESDAMREKANRDYGPIYQKYMPPKPKSRLNPLPPPNPRTLPPITQPPPPPAAQKKSSPDPVISMLATRASSDPDLKALMKEVATGKATQDQLRVFQKHIDELTLLINKPPTDSPKISSFDGPSDEPLRPYATAAPTYTPPPRSLPAYEPPPVMPQLENEVVFSFTTPGATEDRFLFPRHAILEPLSQQHLLASFMLTRPGRQSSNPSLLSQPDTDFWQPVTLMVEVAYGREGILKDVTKWVKPAEEVREEMKRVMARCKRAPEAHLAMRLPFRGSGAASAPESEAASKAGTPVVEVKKTVKAAPKKSALSKGIKKEAVESTGLGAQAREGEKSTAADADAVLGAGAGAGATVDGAVDETTETGRPRRTTRKSVRIMDE